MAWSKERKKTKTTTTLIVRWACIAKRVHSTSTTARVSLHTISPCHSFLVSVSNISVSLSLSLLGRFQPQRDVFSMYGAIPRAQAYGRVCCVCVVRFSFQKGVSVRWQFGYIIVKWFRCRRCCCYHLEHHLHVVVMLSFSQKYSPTLCWFKLCRKFEENIHQKFQNPNDVGIGSEKVKFGVITT